MISKLGIPTNILTGIVNPGSIAGKLTTDLASEFNSSQIPVVAVAEHDTASAIVSVPATEKKYAYLSSGTWSLLGVEISFPIINDAMLGQWLKMLLKIIMQTSCSFHAKGSHQKGN